jgi:uncharacterized RDD family membrane protein YckC
MSDATRNLKSRLGAAFIDHWLITGPFVLIPIIEPAMGINVPAPTYAYFLVYLGYFTIIEAAYGTTPGKTVLNLRVVGVGGGSISWQQSALRNILRVVDFFAVALCSRRSIYMENRPKPAHRRRNSRYDGDS